MIKIDKVLLGGIIIFCVYSVWILFGNKPPKDRFVLAVTHNPLQQQKAEDFQRIEKIKFCADQTGVLKSIVQGQADAGIMDGLIALNLIHLKPQFRNLRLAGDLLDQESVGVAFNPNDDSLRQAVNRGLKEIVANGIFESISTRYFGKDVLANLRIKPTYPDNTPAEDGSWKKVRLADELRFAMSGDNPPFSYLNEHHELSGFEVEIAWEVCIQLGIKNFTPVLVKQKDLISGLTAGRFDGIWNSMKITEENRAVVDFSNPYYVTGSQLVVLRNSPITGPETLVPPELPEPPPRRIKTGGE